MITDFVDTKTVFKHVALYGQSSSQDPNVKGPIPRDFTFNTPIGCCMDRYERVWLCDTGNDRVLVLDKSLTKLLDVLYFPQQGAKGEGGKHFRLPFHLAQHPAKDQMYITDLGNARVVVMNFDKQHASFSHVFGNKASNGGLPLQDPNGITIVRSASDGKYYVHVNDEFFHTPTDKIRNRCVRYTDQGEYVSEFRGVIDPNGTVHNIYWPQGLSSDKFGNLYLANTGSYEILKIAADAPVGKDYIVHAKHSVVMHSFAPPSGVGMLNIMRDVAAIGNHIFVPDQILNTISVYDLHSKLVTILFQIQPSLYHANDTLNSPTDPAYYAIENAALLNPYVICQGESEEVFFVTEPFTSRLMKLNIPHLNGFTANMTLLAALGARRNQAGAPGIDPQFNVATAVVGFKEKLLPKESKESKAATPKTLQAERQQALHNWQELPNWLKYNPWQQWYMAFSAVATAQYELLFGNAMDHLLAQSPAGKNAGNLLVNMDSGNWRMKTYVNEKNHLEDIKRPTTLGYFLPGNLAMATYYPKVALLGQICPKTPILFVTNFDYGTVSMYQVGPTGNLLNYGLPFSFYGEAPGFMRGPQGLEVSADGEIFIADSLNNRMAKWQILQTGQVVFIKNFTWKDRDSKLHPFSPTDVAIDAKNRVFVTDQFNNRICVFNLDGESLWSYGKQGYWSQGQPDGERFMLPTSLVIDGDFLILNDLVNRALKLFKIEEHGLQFMGGLSLFKLTVEEGGVWMPYFMYVRDKQVYIADSTYNIVQVFTY